MDDATINTEALIQDAVQSAPAQPWLEAANELPKGWRLSGSGLYKLSEEIDPQTGAVTQIAHRVASPVWVSGQVRTPESDDWSRVIKWVDRDARLHERTISNARLHEPGNALCAELAKGGLKIVHRKEGALMEFLTNCEPLKRYRLAGETGWIDRADGALLFIRPGQILTNAVDTETYVYSGRFNRVKSAGTLEEWQENVAMPCAPHPFLVFSLCASFAGPLLKYCGIESGGFTLGGLTTAGKTTALQVASSVWGHGGDPGAYGEQAYCRSWSMTANALEAVCASHNDSLLALDELGKADKITYSRMVYLLSGGSGKARLQQDTEMRASRSWRVFVLSSGELSSADKIAESGTKAKGGQLLRLLDIRVPESGIFSHGHDAAAADNLKQMCARYYGTAGPVFIEKLMADLNAERIHRGVINAMQRITEELTPDQATAETKRSIKKFALVKVAGLIAANGGIFPFGVDVVRSSIQFVLNAWLADRQGDSSDSERALSDLRGFLLSNRSRMMFCDELATHIPQKLIGYIQRKDSSNEPELMFLTNQGLREAVAGHDARSVLGELDKRGLLKKLNGFKYRAHVESLGRRLWLYAIHPNIFDLGNEQDSG